MTSPILPQLEHGHTRIANQLLEALARYPFGGGELRALLAVLRLTYGWRKKAAPISAAQVARMTDMSLRHAKRALGSLTEARLLFREKIGRRNILGLNKRYWEWWLWTSAAQGDRSDPLRVTDLSLREGTSLSPLLKKGKKYGKKKTVEPVDSVEMFLHQSLKRPLTPDEAGTVDQLRLLQPEELDTLLGRLAAVCESRPMAL